MGRRPTILDQYGRPVDLSALHEEQAGVSLSGVRRPESQDPSTGLTPGRLAQLLRAAEQNLPADYLALAERMEEKELQYLTVLGTRKRQVSQLEITVTPADDSAEALRDQELIQEFVERNVLQGELFDMLDAVGKGFSVLEIDWDMSERQWRPNSLDWVDQRWITFDTPDRKTPRLIGDGGQGEDLIPYKFVYHVSKCKSGLPIRGGLARPVAWAYLFKNFDIKGWVEFAEIYGQPLRVGKYGPQASEDEKRTLLRAVANIGRDAAAIIPQSMLMEFVEAGGGGGTKGADLYEKLANYLDRSISKAVLGQTATTDAIAGGHAVGKEHNDVRGDIERADANELEATLMRDIVIPMVTLNHGARINYPRIHIGRAEETDISSLSEALSKLVPIGLRVSASEILGKLGLQEPEDEDDVLGAHKPDEPNSDAPTPKPGEEDNAAEPAEGEMGADDQEEQTLARGPADLADRLTAMLDQAAAGALDQTVDQLRAAVDGAPSLQALLEQILLVYPEMDPASLAEIMRAGLVASNLAGRIEADVDGG